MPSTELVETDFTDGKIMISEVMFKAELAKSKSQARQLIQQGGVSIDSEKVTDEVATISLETLKEKQSVIIKKGKKVFHKITLS